MATDARKGQSAASFGFATVVKLLVGGFQCSAHRVGRGERIHDLARQQGSWSSDHGLARRQCRTVGRARHGATTIQTNAKCPPTSPRDSAAMSRPQERAPFQ